MIKTYRWKMLLFSLPVLGLFSINGICQTPTPEAKLSKKVSSAALAVEMEKLEVEKLKLENEKLKLELEKVQMQATLTPASQVLAPTETPVLKTSDDKKRVLESQGAAETAQAEALAQDQKDNENVLILDFLNSEVWNKGVRYGIYEFYNLAKDRGWAMKKSLDERGGDGDARYRYSVRNVSLLKYDGRKPGIFEIQNPDKGELFSILTPEGISLTSTVGNVRNGYQNLYFSFDGQDTKDGLKILKYKHGNGILNQDEKLEFAFERSGKMVNIRYGVLGEN